MMHMLVLQLIYIEELKGSNSMARIQRRVHILKRRFRKIHNISRKIMCRALELEA
jgi:hypothetical protein